MRQDRSVKDKEKAKEQLITELMELRQQIAHSKKHEGHGETFRANKDKLDIAIDASGIGFWSWVDGVSKMDKNLTKR